MEIQRNVKQFWWIWCSHIKIWRRIKKIDGDRSPAFGRWVEVGSMPLVLNYYQKDLSFFTLYKVTPPFTKARKTLAVLWVSLVEWVRTYGCLVSARRGVIYSEGKALSGGHWIEGCGRVQKCKNYIFIFLFHLVNYHCLFDIWDK